MTPDADKLNAFLGKFVNDLGAALHAGMVVVGDKLGLGLWLLAFGCGSTHAAPNASSDGSSAGGAGGAGDDRAAGGARNLESGGAPSSDAGGEAGFSQGEPPHGAGSSAGDAATSDSDAGAAGTGNDEPEHTLVPGVSERKRLRSSSGTTWVLEETLLGFGEDRPPATRVRRLRGTDLTEPGWPAPDGQYISDVCLHPSGELSVALVSENHVVSLVRLAGDLTPLGNYELHDPDVAQDPHASGTGVGDLQAKSLIWDAVRACANGEATFTVVVTSLNAVIGYRQHFADGVWSAPERTLIEPPSALSPHLPTGGSFDPFGAIVEWFRAPLDIDQQGNAYVATWASPKRIRDHVAVFADELAPLPADPLAPQAGDSDILLTKLDPDGRRLWTRVVGSEHEDEPYSVRTHGDFVAVVGRARRFPGFDNTIWDGLVSVTSATGDDAGSRTLAFDASSILLAVDARPTGGWLLAGSEGWTQNPDGLSILSYGTKLLLELPRLEDAPLRRPLAQAPRHSQLNSVLGVADRILFAGHEDGPITHSGDEDPAEIHATGVLGSLPLEP